MRDQQRQHKGEREDRDDERLGVAHELEHKRIGDALAQARPLDRAGDEVGADDEPHSGLSPRAKRGGDRRRDARGACVVHAHLKQNEQRAVEQAHKARLCHATSPEHHRGERQRQTGLTADRKLDRRAQLRQRKKLHQQKDNDTQHKANFALGDLKRLLFRFHLPTFLVGGTQRRAWGRYSKRECPLLDTPYVALCCGNTVKRIFWMGSDPLDKNHHNIRRFSSFSRFSSNVVTVWIWQRDCTFVT